MFMRVASLYDATAFAWGFCRARRHGILMKREWVTNCVVKSSDFLVVFVFLFTSYRGLEMSLKVTDVLNRYRGEGDVSVWLKQAQLAKSLLKLKDLAVVIPLFLDGPAFAVYDQLSDYDKADATKIEAALRTAFATDKFSAYDKFRNRKWKSGETVDVFLAEIKRLASLANIGGEENEEIVKLAFVMGLPSKVAAQLKATPKIDTLNLSSILQIARAFMTEITKSDSLFEVGAVARASRDKGCFTCGGPHYRKNCRKEKAKEVICFSCNKPGHIARYCNSTGNAQGVLPAPAVTPEASTAQSSHE